MIKKILISMAILCGLYSATYAQNLPAGSVGILTNNTPNTWQTFTYTFTPSTTGANFIGFAFRQDPAFWTFDNVRLTASGSTTNLLTNGAFDNGGSFSVTTNNGPSQIQAPTDWGVWYQNGTYPAAAGAWQNGAAPHGGVWYDGAVGSFDGIYQGVNLTAGTAYTITFDVSGNHTADNGPVQLGTYGGACASVSVAPSQCTIPPSVGFTTLATPAQGAAAGIPTPPTPTTFSTVATGNTVASDTLATGAFTGAGGTLQIVSGQSTVSNPITLTTGLIANSNSQNGTLSGVISGSGGLTVTGTAGTITLTGVNTYTGLTQINQGATLNNQGTINGASNITNDGTFNNSGTAGNVTNNGTANNTGILGNIVNNISRLFTNSGTTGSVNNAGTFNNNVNSIAGAVTNAGTGTFTNSGTIASLDNSGIFVNNGPISGDITNRTTGNFTNNSNGNFSSFTNDGIATNTGTLTNGSVTNNSNGMITNTGSITGGTIANYGRIDNTGTAGAVTNNTNGIFNNNTNGQTGAFTNAGTLANNGIILSLTNTGSVTNSGSVTGSTTNNGTTTNSGTLHAVTNAGTFNNNATGTTGNVTNSGTFNFNRGTIGNLNNTGTFNIANNNQITATILGQTFYGTRIPTMIGSGIVTLGSNYLVIANGSNNAYSGPIRGTGGFALETGTFTLSGTSTYAGYTGINNGATLNNSGRIASTVVNNGTFNNTGTSGNIANATLGVVNNSGTSGDIINAGTFNLRGPATLGNVNNNGIFNIGTYNGDVTLPTFTQTTTGNLILAGGQQLNVTGAATLDGTLTLNNSPTQFGRYNLINAGNVLGTFATLTLNPDISPLGSYLKYTDTGVKLYVTPSSVATIQSIETVKGDLASMNGIVSGRTGGALGNDCAGSNGCVSIGFGKTATSKSGSITIGKKINDNIRVGIFLDRSFTNPVEGNVSYRASNPVVGGLVGWNQNGWDVALSAATGSGTYTINRPLFDGAESGSGTAKVGTRATQLRTSYSIPLADDITLTPYGAIRYSRLNVAGYTENGPVFPLSINPYKENLTELMGGIGINKKVTDKISVNAAVGFSKNIRPVAGTLSGTSEIAGLDKFNTAFATGKSLSFDTSAGISYQFIPNHKISLGVGFEQKSLMNPQASSIGLNYTYGF